MNSQSSQQPGSQMQPGPLKSMQTNSQENLLSMRSHGISEEESLMSLSSKNHRSKAQLEDPSNFSSNKHELSVKLPYGSRQNVGHQAIAKSSPSMLAESQIDD